MKVNPVELASRLVQCNTVKIDGGDERKALETVLAPVLREAGFTVDIYPYDPENPKRASLVARLKPGSKAPALLFAGHVDTVPFGTNPWKEDPLSGSVHDGKLHGRGSTDMKSGVACYVAAAVELADAVKKSPADLVIQVYGGEETGDEGSRDISNRPGLLADVKAVVVAEPTGAKPLAGHKGCFWLKAQTKGKTAHGSMPENGVNALAKLVPFANEALSFTLPGTHPILGHGTVVLSCLHGGFNINNVPDDAWLTLDIRTIPGQVHAEIRKTLERMAGPEVKFSTLLDLAPVWTESTNPWFAHAMEVLTPVLGEKPREAGAMFFTDAATLRPKLPSVPMMIFGPGPGHMAHQTDEYCPVADIEKVFSADCALIKDWAAGAANL